VERNFSFSFLISSTREIRRQRKIPNDCRNLFHVQPNTRAKKPAKGRQRSAIVFFVHCGKIAVRTIVCVDFLSASLFCGKIAQYIEVQSK
jgi:hypothetical protein